MEDIKNNLEPVDYIEVETLSQLQSIEPVEENLAIDVVEECLISEFPIELFNKIMNDSKRL